jgi:hypothetical protein
MNKIWALQAKAEAYRRCEQRNPQISPLRYPEFPDDLGGVGLLHAPFFTERRKRGSV